MAMADVPSEEAMAAQIFMRMMAMPHTDLYFRIGGYPVSPGPNPAEVAEYARMAAAVFFAKFRAEDEQPGDDA